MGKSDTISKELLQDNNYFADVVNNALFNGDRVVNPDELVELDSTELTVIEDETKNTAVQKQRDILKKAVILRDKKAVYVILGIENQTDINYAMPVRIMTYDAFRYSKQVEKAAKKHREETKKHRNKIKTVDGKNITGAEFLSGWKKEDKLIPVITLTVYYGTDEWDGALSIHGMFAREIDEKILGMIPDYRISILEPKKINNWDNFQTDIGALFHAIAVSDTEYGLDDLFDPEHGMYRNLDNEIVKAINFYTESNFCIEEGKERTDMCIAVQSSYEKAKSEGIVIGRNEGRAEGRAEGEANGIIIGKITVYLDMNLSIDQIAEKTGLSEKEIQDIIDENNLL
jgi:hypothetical protein